MLETLVSGGCAWSCVVVSVQWCHLTGNSLYTPKRERTSTNHSTYDCNIDMKCVTSHTRTILNLTNTWRKLVCRANAADSWRFAAVRGHSLSSDDSWRFAKNFAHMYHPLKSNAHMKNACMLCKCRQFVTIRGRSLISDTGVHDRCRLSGPADLSV